MSSEPKVSVLFVCYANMCRSPLAEAVFRHMAREREVLDAIEVDSAGTHAASGSAPHPLSVETAATHGITVTGQSRQLYRDDLSRFDHVLVMDRHNLSTIQRLAAPTPSASLDEFPARVRLLRVVANPRARGRDLDVPDPMGGGAKRYREVFDLLSSACEALLDEIVEDLEGEG